MNTIPYLFSFEAKDLQTYILRGGKLKDMAGATSLIDKLSDKAELAKLLTGAFGIASGQFRILQAAAGQARIWFESQEAGQTVNDLWPVWSEAWAPGLTMVQDFRAVGGGVLLVQAMHDASNALRLNRQFPGARMPEAGPFVQRAQRTGEAATARATGLDRDEETHLDQATSRKRAERDLIGRGVLPPIARRFGFTSSSELPKEFSEIAGSERQYLAIIHADGNGLGRMFMEAGQAALDAKLSDQMSEWLFNNLSEKVSDGTRNAVEHAMAALEGERPLLPLVLAGDDVTLVCRADLGLTFVHAFLNAFRDEMGECLQALRADASWKDLPKEVQAAIPEKLTAGAGIVYSAFHYPFSLAYELCEDVCKLAKTTAKKMAGDVAVAPSAVAFVRIVGSSSPTKFEGLLESTHGGPGKRILTANPYFVDGGNGPQLNDLIEVERIAQKLPSSTLREIVNLQRTDYDRVPEAVRRMLEVADGKSKDKLGQQFATAWRRLCQRQAPSEDATWQDLMLAAPESKSSPFLDLVSLLALNNR